MCQATPPASVELQTGKGETLSYAQALPEFKKKTIVNIFFSFNFYTILKERKHDSTSSGTELIIRMSYDDHHIIILAKYQPVPPDIDQVPPQPQHFFLGWPLFTSPPCNAELSQLDVVQTKICLLFS